MKCAFGLLLLLASPLGAVEVSGKWDGFFRPASGTGDSVPLYAIFHEEGGAISGLVAFAADDRQMPIEKAELRGDRLTFQVLDRSNHAVTFDLAVTARSMVGDMSDGQPHKVSLFPSRRPNPFQDGYPTVTAPTLISKVDPEYTEEARQAKHQGTVLLYVEVSPEGKAMNMRVVRGLGLGLDEKAMEAVGKWQFRPGMKDNRPVTVQANIEVNFRLPQ